MLCRCSWSSWPLHDWTQVGDEGAMYTAVSWHRCLLSDEVTGGSMSDEVNVDGVKLIGELRSFGEGRQNTRLKKEKKKKKGRMILICLI
ncbi:hypothetical protein QJS04_geneDACA018177 [Acorus gramineus]|uniref:Uncharacterized protein n=1 Tax=Acorus gramineus TaxID=55184 RepID=A0AAV9AKG1_ACOGR|nr:hypothetical protein QJS04_geneDACA018177 [Acorus gramineus]